MWERKKRGKSLFLAFRQTLKSLLRGAAPISGSVARASSAPSLCAAFTVVWLFLGTKPRLREGSRPFPSLRSVGAAAGKLLPARSWRAAAALEPVEGASPAHPPALPLLPRVPRRVPSRWAFLAAEASPDWTAVGRVTSRFWASALGPHGSLFPLQCCGATFPPVPAGFGFKRQEN